MSEALRLKGSRWEVACLAAVVAVAGWLRLRHLGLVEFKSDEALAIRIARDILHGQIRTVGLTSSAGASNPPLFVYLTAIPLAVRDDPLVATAFVGLVQTATVAVTYLALRSRFGGFVALATAGLFATAPWSVLYGRHLWQPDLLPIVTLGLAWSLLETLDHDRERRAVLIPIFFCLAVQLNFSALALVIPIAAVVGYRARQLHWRALAAGVGVGFLLLAPWLAHNAKHGFTDFTALAEEGRGQGGATVGDGTVAAVRQTLHLVGVGGWRFVTGESQASFTHEMSFAWEVGRAAGILAVVLFAFGLLTSAFRVLRNIERSEGWPGFELRAGVASQALLLTWLAGVWLSYATSSTDKVAPHYMIVTYPISFIVIAVGLSELAQLAPTGLDQAVKVSVTAVVAMMAVAYAGFAISFQHFLARNGGTSGDYGVVYRDKSALAARARARRMNVDDPVLQFLAARSFDPQPDSRGVVTTRDRLDSSQPLRCADERETFGALDACFSRTNR